MWLIYRPLHEPKCIAMFHANLDYAYSTPHRCGSVIRRVYKAIIDTMREVSPKTRHVFEACGSLWDEIKEAEPCRRTMHSWNVLVALSGYIYDGQTIGHKKIDRIEPITTSEVRFCCLKAVEEPVEIRSLAVYGPR